MCGLAFSYALLYTTLVKPPEASSLDAGGLVGSDLEVVVVDK